MSSLSRGFKSLLGLVKRRTAGSLRNSLRGLGYVAAHEEAVRVELALLVVLTPLALWIGDSPLERLLLVASAVLVILVELLNTAIELALDRFRRSHHPLAGAAKDVGSAAVLLTMLLFLLVWGVLLSS